MQISYKPLWKLLVDEEMNKKELCEIANISTTTMARITKNQSVMLDTLLKICSTLKCKLPDVVEFVDSDNEIT